MTHIFENNWENELLLPKVHRKLFLRFLNFLKMKKNLRQQIQEFGKQGYRVLGVAKCDFKGNNFPEKQQN